MINKFAIAIISFVTVSAATIEARAASVTALGAGVLIDPTAAADGISSGLATFNSPGLTSNTPYGNSSTPQGAFTQGGASFFGDGILMTNPGQDSLGLYAEPAGDTTQYLTIRPYVSSPSGIATETVTFGGLKLSSLGLFWGSMDSYNSIKFYLGNNLIDTVTGTDAAAAVPPSGPASGNQVSDANNRYVIISSLLGGGLFDSIVLTSGQNSFELDNLAWGNSFSREEGPAPTPLPAALSLFAGGLGVLGFLTGRRKKKSGTASPAA